MKNVLLINYFLTAACGLMITFSCNSSNTNNNTTTQDSIANVDSALAIEVTPLPHAKEFPGATLTISSLGSEKLGNDSAKVTIKYAVQNFNLTDQTDHEHHMANSSDGQHIHFILNNAPYVALYKPEHSFNVPINSEHYLLSFLSRSFHESIKTTDASKLIKFKVNADGKIEEQNVPTEPSLFYSRPKGDYKGDDTKSVLLDFFLVNADISPDANKVKAVINGQEFVLDRWVPYEITNLPKGEATIQLTLVNAEGNALTGDNVTIERKSNFLE
ncbi:hypothetical protein [Sphingobacterium composti Ten et al. 2007 non Yoo et al. 2007]|uniref:hypothetical protein n=1 Tax=Sphingobacterium composti TaxID=363260 RepID=UPI001358A3FD|nr:hypothetical protein [Sphingobacterium composti Ten et al. 2007 non Yoo et al. 2007]